MVKSKKKLKRKKGFLFLQCENIKKKKKQKRRSFIVIENK